MKSEVSDSAIMLDHRNAKAQMITEYLPPAHDVVVEHATSPP